jgi:hypothetical protein
MALPKHLLALLEPGAYPHPVAPIKLIETPTSWVLLTGSLAYKLKRPIHYPFLDQRTLERRSGLCREELRLNRRFAPQLYLQTDPISIHAGSARMGDPTAPLEYAVRMVQFDSAAGLDRLLEAAAVAPPQLHQFGVDLAAIHARLPVAGPAQRLGQADTVPQRVRANFDECRDYARPLGRAAEIEALREPLERALAAVSELLPARHSAGQVRECHGDLHARNVVRWSGKLQAFDCLEFEPGLRWIDVAAEISFLLMDLQVRQAAPHAQAFLAGYLAATGDYQACRLTGLYRLHFALVRAKIAALEAAGAGGDAAALARYCSYRNAAQELGRPNRPALIVMYGTSGSGKSWLAAQIAPRIGALHIRSDVERKRLAGPGAADLYTPAWTQRTYARVVACAREALAGGYRVIADASFLRLEHRAAVYGMARALQVPVLLVHCHAPAALQTERLEQRRARGTDASDADLAVLSWQQSIAVPPTAAEGVPILDADTSGAHVVERILAGMPDDQLTVNPGKPAAAMASHFWR